MARRRKNIPFSQPFDNFYSSPAWRTLRLIVLRRDRFRCVVCAGSVAARGAARVDHILPRRSHPHLALEPANLRTLCAAHDNQAHREKGARGGGRLSDPVRILTGDYPVRRERFNIAVGADGWPKEN